MYVNLVIFSTVLAMTFETELNQYYHIINVSNDELDAMIDELDGKIGKCEGFYALDDKTLPIIRFIRPLSTGQRSMILSSDFLELVESYQPPTVDFVKKTD